LHRAQGVSPLLLSAIKATIALHTIVSVILIAAFVVEDGVKG
jgi:hypothetical protein